MHKSGKVAFLDVSLTCCHLFLLCFSVLKVTREHLHNLLLANPLVLLGGTESYSRKVTHNLDTYQDNRHLKCFHLCTFKVNTLITSYNF